MCGIPAEALVATVGEYNAFAAAHADTAFGRTAFTETSAIENPPFYASPRTWAAHILRRRPSRLPVGQGRAGGRRVHAPHGP